MVAAPACAEHVNLQLKWKHAFQFAGYYMAKEKGFYQDQGLDVSILEASQGQVVDDVIQESVSFSVGDFGSIIGHKGGHGLRVLAAIFQHNPLVLMVLQSSQIHQWEDLKGKRIMLAPGLNADIKAALLVAGISAKDYVLQDTSYNIQDLVDGKTDAFAAYSTDQPRRLDLQGIGYRLLYPADEDIDFYDDLLITSAQATRRYPERVQAFTAASLQGWAYALNHIDESIDVILEQYNTQQFSRQDLHAEAVATKKMILGDVVQVGYMSKQRWAHISDVYKQQGLLPMSFDIDAIIYQPKPGFFAVTLAYIQEILMLGVLLLIVFFVLHIWRLKSEVRQRTAHLARSDARFKALFYGNRCVELVLDEATGDVIEANTAAELFYGYTRAQLLEKNIADINTLSKSGVAKELRAASDDKRSHFFFKHRLADGSIRDVEVYSGPMIWDNKQVIYSIIHDITQRKRAEALVQKLSRAIEHVGEAIVITDADGLFEYANPAFTKITGYTLEDVLEKKTTHFFSHALSDQINADLWQHLRDGKVWRAKIKDERKDGLKFSGMLTVSSLKNAQGRITHNVALLQDLTSRDALENSFYQAQKMEAIGTLVGGIAHDFNNTLAGILGNLYLAKMQQDLAPAVGKRLETIESLSIRAADMISQLLTFARKSLVSLEPLELNAFMVDLQRFFDASIPEHVEVKYNIPKLPLLVLGDVTQLHQILMNLLGNALDAVVAIAQPRIAVTLALFEADDAFLLTHPYFNHGKYARLSVSDNGCGIESNNLQHIFEPFFTTKEQGKGTGLGLAMVFGAAKSHAGFLEVESELGIGTTFEVYIPLTTKPVSAQTMAQDLLVIEGRGECILIVDDEANVLSAGEEVLTSLGYSVLTATDGVMATQVFMQHAEDIDLVLIDVVMPKLGGFEAVAAMRNIRSDFKVIFSSGYDKDDVLKPHTGRDAEMMLAKPYSIQSLSQILRKALDGN